MSSSATSTLSRSGIPSMHRKLAAKNRTKDGFDVFQIAAEGKITDMNSIVNKNCELLKSVDEDDRQPIHWAAKAGNWENVNFMLIGNWGININAVDEQHWSPLHFAVNGGHSSVVQLLVDKGANLNLQSTKGMTPLGLAAIKDKDKCFQILIKKQADINIVDNQKQSILHQAARRNSLKILKLIIEDSNILKTLLKLKDEEGNTALHLACEEIHEDAVLLLIKCGADLNEKNANKKTPLQLCSPEFKKLIESKTAK